MVTVSVYGKWSSIDPIDNVKAKKAACYSYHFYALAIWFSCTDFGPSRGDRGEAGTKLFFVYILYFSVRVNPGCAYFSVFGDL